MKAQNNSVNDVFRIAMADAEADLKEEHEALMNELLRLAIAQNPELAKRIESIRTQQEHIRDLRRADAIRIYKEKSEREEEERKAQRKISYDDGRNYNKLNAIRRDPYYKSIPRLEQIQMELDEYWNPYGIEPPKELMRSYKRLKARKMEKSNGQTSSPTLLGLLIAS